VLIACRKISLEYLSVDSLFCFRPFFFCIDRQKSAFFVGIGFITAVSWFRNSSVTYFPDNALGDARFDYFKKVVNIEPLDKLLAPYTNDMNDVGVALFTFLYVDFLDTSVRTGFTVLLLLLVVMSLLHCKRLYPLHCRSSYYFVLPCREHSWDSYLQKPLETSYIACDSLCVSTSITWSVKQFRRFWESVLLPLILFPIPFSFFPPSFSFSFPPFP
jgi:hypothetical protein